ncbi:hypothetical protein [Flavobacterium limnophilum]|uniref:hypothetical protein n=1 Tax=Flavobacterium limnophilum TaxID=3003262 RepID=UPI0022AC5BD1|nr:hypothetical protein [Flavobacterium limnophilum]
MSKIIVSEGFPITDFHKKELELIQSLIDNFDGNFFVYNYNSIFGFYVDGNCSSLQNELLHLIIILSEGYRNIHKPVPVLIDKISTRCDVYINNFSKDSEFQALIKNFIDVFYKTDLALFLDADEMEQISFVRDKYFTKLCRFYNQN